MSRASLGPSGGEALFLAAGWRELICRCEGCVRLLADHHMSHLYCEVPVYEPEPDEEAQVSLYEKGTRALDQIVNRDVAIRGIDAVRAFKAKLHAFLEPFGRDKRIVTKEVPHAGSRPNLG